MSKILSGGGRVSRLQRGQGGEGERDSEECGGRGGVFMGKVGRNVRGRTPESSPLLARLSSASFRKGDQFAAIRPPRRRWLTYASAMARRNGAFTTSIFVPHRSRFEDPDHVPGTHPDAAKNWPAGQ